MTMILMLIILIILIIVNVILHCGVGLLAGLLSCRMVLNCGAELWCRVVVLYLLLL